MAEKIVKDSQGLAKDLVNDCISRKAAIERATKDHDFYKGATTPADMARRDELLNVMCWLGELPSSQPKSYREGYQAGFKDAQSERKRGKWIAVTEDGDVYKRICSCCGQEAFFQNDDPDELYDGGRYELSDFCPHCGADMREVDE